MTKDTIVLLHGIFRGRADMWPLQKYLEFKGYDVLNISYPARRRKLEDLAIILHHKIHKHKKYNPEAKLHFVTHSLGGLLARYYIRDFCPDNLGRVVMLGPPNSGSEWTDYMLKKSWLKPVFSFGFGPVGEQLLTTHMHNDCDDADYDLGIIAGRKNAVPFAKYIIEGASDGMVPVERTKHKSMKDHLVMVVTHTYMITKPSVMRQVLAFLQNGKFSN